LLGFDVVPLGERQGLDGDLAARQEVIDEGRVLGDYLTARTASITAGHRPLAGELALLDVFADLAELSRNRPSGEESGKDTHVHSAREFFHTYLQSLDVERAGLPAAFQAKLAKALGHYGVTDLERTPEVEAAVFRVFLAQQRAAADAGVIAALLRAWLTEPSPDESMREPAGLVLERLMAATQVRFPVLADLARGVVFAWFAQPLLRRNRARVYAGVRKHLRHLDAHPDSADRAGRIAEMVRTTEPLVRLLGQRLDRGDRDNSVMLEVLTRRYYGNKGLSDVRTAEVGDRSFVIAERTGSWLVSSAAAFDDLGDVLRGLAGLGEGETEIDADVYLAWEDQPADSAAMASALHAVVAAHPLPSRVRRLTTTVAGRSGAVMHHHFTFRRDGAELTEDRLIRGLHPYIAQRMQMERFGKFDLTRLPSSDEEVYLFRAVARENSSDDRLVAFAQVRDLTELREHDGRLVALPTAEDTVAACLDSIRRAQALRPAKNRFTTNRAVIYVWPPVDITREELGMIAGRVRPTTGGAGLEEILFIARRRDRQTGELRKMHLRISFNAARDAELTFGEPTDEPVEPLDDYRLKVLRAAGRNAVYPYELTAMLGDFAEYDLDEAHALVPVSRPKGRNSAAIVAGVVTTRTERHPEGLARVVLLGD
ncbi:MAG TPA: fused acetyl/propionyl-CoA carboxylase subunit alpha/methylmalonyl-CoA decarboxylase subunit alpha, partial [Phytomonospora sp.]